MIDKSRDELHERTREIYERQHLRIAGDKATFDRLLDVYGPRSFGIDPDWFRAKLALDAGCGNNGALIVRLAQVGCARVHACDIGTSWIPMLTDRLQRAGVPMDRVDLRKGNVLELPYEDEQFDFVAINGVLLHLKDMDEIRLGFAEGARVCKRGGYYFTGFGPSGGLMQGRIMPAVREHYSEDPDFRWLIDNISPQLLHDVVDKICADSERHGGPQIDGAFLQSLFGEDFCVFLQNFVQAPKWWSNECTPEFVEGLYEQGGFVQVKRLNDFVKRTDIRKFFAPLHYDREHPVSRALYGHGYVKYIAQKA